MYHVFEIIPMYGCKLVVQCTETEKLLFSEGRMLILNEEIYVELAVLHAKFTHLKAHYCLLVIFSANGGLSLLHTQIQSVLKMGIPS